MDHLWRCAKYLLKYVFTWHCGHYCVKEAKYWFVNKAWKCISGWCIWLSGSVNCSVKFLQAYDRKQENFKNSKVLLHSRITRITRKSSWLTMKSRSSKKTQTKILKQQYNNESKLSGFLWNTELINMRNTALFPRSWVNSRRDAIYQMIYSSE